MVYEPAANERFFHALLLLHTTVTKQENKFVYRTIGRRNNLPKRKGGDLEIEKTERWGKNLGSPLPFAPKPLCLGLMQGRIGSLIPSAFGPSPLPGWSPHLVRILFATSVIRTDGWDVRLSKGSPEIYTVRSEPSCHQPFSMHLQFGPLGYRLPDDDDDLVLSLSELGLFLN